MRLSLALFSSWIAPAVAALAISRTVFLASSHRSSLLFSASAGAVLALPLISLCSFLFILGFGATGIAAALGDSLLVCISLGLLARTHRNTRCNGSSHEQIGAPTTGSGLTSLRLLLGLIGCLNLGKSILALYLNPHGASDAYVTWNMRARFLYRLGPNWTFSFTPHLTWSLPEYPLLVPLLVWRGWLYAGYETQIVPSTVALIWALLGFSVIVGALNILRGPVCACLAGISFLSCGLWLAVAVGQSADIPVATLLVTSISLILVAHNSLYHHELFALAGFAAASCAWTKNEGIAHCLVLAFLVLFLVSRHEPLAKRVRHAGFFALGMLPAAAAVTYFKIFLAPPTFLVLRHDDYSSVAALFDLSRWITVLSQISSDICRYYKGAVILALLVAVATAAGLTPRLKHVYWIAVWLLAMLLIYATVIVTSPHDTRWQAATTCARLLLHLMPSAILLAFLLFDRTTWESLALPLLDPRGVINGTRRGRT